MIHIRAGRRFNIYAPQTIADVQYPTFLDPAVRARLGIIEVPEPAAPEDYTPDTYFRTEQDEYPFVVYTRKAPEAVAAVRWEKLKQHRDHLALEGGCFCAGKWFHSDLYSKQQQMALAMLGGSLPANLQWKTMDGSYILLTPQIVADLFAAQIAREQLLFTIAETKRVDDTPVYEGWPARFEQPQEQL